MTPAPERRGRRRALRAVLAATRPTPAVARALALSLAIGSAACSRAGDGVMIAAAGNWDAGYGEMNKRGIELALEQVNAEGGIGGRPLRAVMRNDKGEGSRAVTIAAELVAMPEVVAVVGHVNSGTMVAAARVYNEGLPAVSTTASTPDLSGMSRWVFRVISSDSVNGRDLARHARSRGLSRAAILYENNAYGRGLAQAFERNFDGEVVSADPIPSTADGDMEPFVSWIARRAPDVVFVAGTEASGLAVLREARRQGVRAAFLGSDGWSGVVREPQLAEGVMVGAPFTAEDPRDDVRRFVAAFRARFGMAPDGNAALAYDATMLVAQAVREGGGTRRAVRDWLAARTPANSVPGVTGPIAFHASGDVVGKGYVMTRVRRGMLVVDTEGGS